MQSKESTLWIITGPIVLSGRRKWGETPQIAKCFEVIHLTFARYPILYDLLIPTYALVKVEILKRVKYYQKSKFTYVTRTGRWRHAALLVLPPPQRDPNHGRRRRNGHTVASMTAESTIYRVVSMAVAMRITAIIFLPGDHMSGPR